MSQSESNQGQMPAELVSGSRGSPAFESRLLEENIYLRSALDSASDGVMIIDQTGTVREVNATFCRLTGMTRDAFVGKPADVLSRLPIQAHKGQRMTEVMRASAAGAQMAPFEVEYDGRVLEINLRPVTQGPGMGILVRDVTDRRRAQQLEREALEQQDRRIVECLGEGVMLTDSKALILYANPAAEAMFGVAKGGLNGRSLSDYLSRGERGKLLAHMSSEGVTEPKQIELVVNRADKTSRTFSVTTAKLDGSIRLGRLPESEEQTARKAECYLLGLRDVTELKQTLEHVQQQEQKLAAILENAGEGIVCIDRRGVVIEANPAFTRVTGLTREEVMGKTVPELATRLVKLSDIPKVVGGFKDFILGRPTSNYEVEFRGKIIEVGMPTQTKGKVLVGLIRDVSERRRAQEALAAKNEELARSNQELQHFAYVASHDLQEPLRMVSSYTQLLAKRYKGKLDKDADEFIAFAVDGATRMQALINGLLEYARVGTRGKEPVPVDSEEVLRGVLRNLEILIGENNVRVTHDPLPMVRADRVQLGQLLQNLIANAIKFRGSAPPEIHISARQEDGFWQFQVKDNGIGIAKEHYDRIFQIFQRLHTRDKYPGTGIGLAVCKRIVERHGGRIWVESQPGKGSSFFFTLPTSDARAGMVGISERS
ncbi:MAG: PAS domain S-box protein [candidate division WOR-3 bacterium]